MLLLPAADRDRANVTYPAALDSAVLIIIYEYAIGQNIEFSFIAALPAPRPSCTTTERACFILSQCIDCMYT